MIAFVLIPLLGLLAVVVPVVLLVHAAAGVAPHPWTVWTRLAIVAACAGTAIYAYGYFESAPFFMDAEDVCDIGVYSPAARSAFPLSAPVCVDSGQRIDLVPAFVNPTLYLAIGLTAACAAAAAISRRQASRATRLQDIEARLRYLLRQWDPIGVAEISFDEYDCLVAPLLSKLMGGAGKAEVSEFLRHELENHFGLDPLFHDIDSMVDRLVAWWAADGSAHQSIAGG